MSIILPISLTFAAALALLNIWLSIRVGQVRTREKISVGDGGNEALVRRMRAHSNFIENSAFVLVLIILIELALGTLLSLWIATGLYVLARIAHAFGMDGLSGARMVGTLTTLLLQLALALYALAIPYLTTSDAGPQTIIVQPDEQMPQ